VGSLPVSLLKERMLLACCCAVILVIASCNRHDNESFYPVVSDAEKDGAITRGWIPEFLPKTSRNIHETHDLSPSTEWATFEFEPRDSETLRSALQARSTQERSANISA
jgi:hypothetical protein